MGELSLDGSLQPIKGALPIAIKAREEGFKHFILPKENAKEAAIVNDLMSGLFSSYFRSWNHANSSHRYFEDQDDRF